MTAAVVLNSCKKQSEPAQSAAPEQAKVEAPEQPSATAPAPAEASLSGGRCGEKGAEPAHKLRQGTASSAKLKEKAPKLTSKIRLPPAANSPSTVTRAWAPLEADRFYNLVKHHFYDNAAFSEWYELVVQSASVQICRERCIAARGNEGRSLRRKPTSAVPSRLLKPEVRIRRGTQVFHQPERQSAPRSHGTRLAPFASLTAMA